MTYQIDWMKNEDIVFFVFPVKNHMKTEKNPVEKITPLEDTKRWPVAITSAFLIVHIASFIPWGTINYHYTWQFMANMEHPGLCNRIITDDDLSGIKLGTKLNHTGSAWKAGFDKLICFFLIGYLRS